MAAGRPRREGRSLGRSSAERLLLAAVTFTLQSPGHGGLRHLRAPPDDGRTQRPLDEGGQFREAVGDVLRLVAETLAGDHEMPLMGQSRGDQRHQPPTDRIGQRRGAAHVVAEHCLAAGPVDVLAAGPATAHEVPGQFMRRDDHRAVADPDFLVACHLR